MITIFTPTYNRKKELERLYESLLNQDYDDFEWLIVDDGSIDDTEKYVNSLIKKNKMYIMNIEIVIIEIFDFLRYATSKEIFIIKDGMFSYNGVVYFKSRYKIEKIVTTISKSFSFLLKVFVYAR